MRSKIVALSKNEEFKSLLKKKKVSNKYATIFFGKLDKKNNEKLNISFVTKKKIGNAVQRNKIKYMAPYVDLIHGIDSFKSLSTINKEGEKNNRIIKCLLQLKISGESTKFGLEIDELEKIIQSPEYKKLSFVKVCGIMAMASFTTDLELVREEFNIASKLYNRIKKVNSDFQILSMGMSNDYKIAIEAGSNMIRIGSLIFGERT